MYFIRVFMLITLLSCIYIAYVLLSDEYYQQFMMEQEITNRHYGKNLHTVHPLFKYLQANYDPSARFKNQYATDWDTKEIFPVPEV